MSQRIIFAGTPDFAAVHLKALLEANFEIVAVYTQPDRPAGRGHKLTPSPVKSLALEHNLPVFTPVNFKDEADIAAWESHQADLAIVVAYGLILPERVLNAPRLGCINVHGSLLPKWRGAAPIQRALFSGDPITGVTIMQIVKALDAGAMLVKRELTIAPEDTSGTLLISKNDEAQTYLARQFFVHSIERRYTAIVWGDMEEDSGTVIGDIGRDPANRIRFKVVEDGSGKHAVTHWKVLERLGYVTVIECSLETGRTHQIRVHMNHIGHPLFNDSLYGGDRILKGTLYSRYRQFIDNCFEVLPRQALHAGTIGFIHPRTHKKIVVSSELADDMKALIEKFRNFTGNRQ